MMMMMVMTEQSLLGVRVMQLALQIALIVRGSSVWLYHW